MAERKITQSSTAEYFSKNLQQVGFSSFTKATLTTVKEAIDNSLDACEDAGILPEIRVLVERIGEGSSKGSELVRVVVDDNGPGVSIDDVVMVFGEYLASSKFGRGRCSRGQQGIGISAVTTWAQLTHGSGAKVITKTKSMRQAQKCEIVVDIKKNQGILKSKESIEWDRPSGLLCEFIIDARVQMGGEGGILAYLQGTSLVNPHLTVHFKLPGDDDFKTIERVTTDTPEIPEATEPHPHTMKLGEFIAHSHLYGKISLAKFLKTAFSRISDAVIQDISKQSKLPKKLFEANLTSVSEENMRKIYAALQVAPSTKSVLMIGEANLAKSIHRLGEVDFFSVVSRKPAICDFKPVLVEVAIARQKKATETERDSPVQILRFANRVPLQFDKAACAISKSIESVNWKAYGLSQPKQSQPLGPYIIAVSIVSPFIKFKNASKETIDASDELVDPEHRAGDASQAYAPRPCLSFRRHRALQPQPNLEGLS
jgi:DNA topoisomerase-6 subunit B